MAQISASYHVAMARALPGQVSDTSAYNIDGACVLDGDAGSTIYVGVGVQHGGVSANGEKLIKALEMLMVLLFDPTSRLLQKMVAWFMRLVVELT